MLTITSLLPVVVLLLLFHHVSSHPLPEAVTVYTADTAEDIVTQHKQLSTMVTTSLCYVHIKPIIPRTSTGTTDSGPPYTKATQEPEGKEATISIRQR